MLRVGGNLWHKLEGLIATNSVPQKIIVVPESIHKVIDAYCEVRENLIKDAEGFPTADRLRALVKQVLLVYGMDGISSGKNSEGSDWIIRVLERSDDRPL